jgi:hypothetical protein
MRRGPLVASGARYSFRGASWSAEDAHRGHAPVGRDHHGWPAWAPRKVMALWARALARP